MPKQKIWFKKLQYLTQLANQHCSEKERIDNRKRLPFARRQTDCMPFGIQNWIIFFEDFQNMIYVFVSHNVNWVDGFKV